jgi:hypothetical protein
MIFPALLALEHPGPFSIFLLEIREFDKWSTERGQVDAGQEGNKMQSVGFHLRYGKDLRAGQALHLSRWSVQNSKVDFQSAEHRSLASRDALFLSVPLDPVRA